MTNITFSDKGELEEVLINADTTSNQNIRLLDNFSSKSLQDPLRKYKKLYLILAILGAIAGFIVTFTPFGSLFFAFIGVVLAWFIIQGISLVRLLKLNWIDYSLPSSVTEKQLLDYLQNNFKHPEIQIEKGLIRGIDFIFNKTTIHTVSVYEKEKKFNIHSKMAKMARLKRGGRENSAKVYVIASQIVPFLSDLIKDAADSIDKNSHKQ
ncbi:DUF456 domain-containing protein [Brevibacillus borstelensis]|uniref:DUF456 domain-containing protein n=1 Tax=Brevibacillus borstelensis TaxID=45462 RepID=UPI002E22D5BC|nr:DUF456 domain-containing protein [Brevibacillus borstelensis]